MKKIFLILFCFCAVFIFSACTPNLTNLVEDNLSDIRYHVYDTDTDQAFIHYVYGMREEKYLFNGEHTKNVEFGIITAIFKNNVNFNEVDFSLTANGETFNGKLEKNPYSNEYMADIGKMLITDDVILVTIYTESSISAELSLKSDVWEIGHEEALSIGIQALEDKLEEHVSNGRLNAECYLKIVSDIHNTNNVYFWMFSFVATDQTAHSVMFDVNTGKILAKN